ncbi:hypothetical protein PMAYCL1PPCAC_21403, partial [Pristionchus mayeri]
QCRDGFRPYSGLCVYATDPEEKMYKEAVANCTAMGAFAPSIHSRTDLAFWAGALNKLTPVYTHFWLDAYCPIAGGKYVWRDGTPTDYLGPNGELDNCDPAIGFHIHPDGISPFKNNYVAAALCAYEPQPQPAALPTEAAPEELATDEISEGRARASTFTPRASTRSPTTSSPAPSVPTIRSRNPPLFQRNRPPVHLPLEQFPLNPRLQRSLLVSIQ